MNRKIMTNINRLSRPKFIVSLSLAETIKIDPGYVKAYNKTGMIMAELGEFEKADEFFTEAICIDPDYSEARKNRAILRRSAS